MVETAVDVLHLLGGDHPALSRESFRLVQGPSMKVSRRRVRRREAFLQGVHVALGWI